MSRSDKPRRPPSTLQLWSGLALVGLAYATIIAIITTANLTEDTGSWIRWIIQCAPLLVVLPGLLMRHYRAFSWLCFIIILYFIPSVAKTMAVEGDWMDPIMLACTLIIFFGSAMCSRWIQTHNLQLTSPNIIQKQDQVEDHHD